MNYSKKYRVTTLDGYVLGYGSTKQKAVALALQQADRLKESINVQKRLADGDYSDRTMVMNPEKFVTPEGGIIWVQKGGDTHSTTE